MMAVDVRFCFIANSIERGSYAPCSHTPEALLSFFTECRVHKDHFAAKIAT